MEAYPRIVSGTVYGRAVTVERWYERQTRCWWITMRNDAGYQIGDSKSVYSEREAVAEQKRMASGN